MATTTENTDGEVKPYYTPGPDAIDISPDKDGGVMKEIVTPGSSSKTPCRGNKVSVHYTGRLLDGTQFDSSVDRGEKFEFTLGKGEVIKAWDIGVATMTKGEKCILQCRCDYAYGTKGSPPKIPEGATLVFEVELFDWQLEDISPDHDKGILRTVIQEGEGYSTPNEGASVEVHLVGKFNENVFEERDVKFEVGEGSEAGVVKGVDVAVAHFKKGEKSLITLSPNFAFGSLGKEEFNIPPNSTVEYEITLKSFEKEKDTWSMSAEEKLEQSEIVKNKGTNYFKDGKYEVASKQYRKIIEYLENEAKLEEHQKGQKNSLLLAGYLNLAACFLKLEKHLDVVENCKKALEIEPKNVKGLFRKGQAHFALKNFESAKKEFQQVLEVDSSNRAAQKQLYLCNDKMKKELEREKKMYKAIFQKMAEENAQEPEETIVPDTTMEELTSEEAEAFNAGIETDDEKQAAAEAVKV